MKINEKNLAAFATSGTQIDREGYLMKKGDGNKSFVKRWFILKGNLLFYFEKKSDKEPIGVIILEGSTIELAESEMEEKYCFKVIFPTRSYILSAESQLSMEHWMKSLACASYDYVKLMAAELQRQLDELGRDEIKSGQLKDKQSNIPSMPTPPPRQRNTKNVVRANQRRTFASLHDEYGAKILKDQQARWQESELSSGVSKSNNNQQAPLSLSKNIKNDTLINF